MKQRKNPSDRLRRLVHVLFNDDDYIRLLRISSPTGLSEWCRNVIKEALQKSEAGD